MLSSCNSAETKLAVFDFGPSVFGVFDLVDDISVFFVDCFQELQLLAFLDQKLFVLLK